MFHITSKLSIDPVLFGNAPFVLCNMKKTVEVDVTMGKQQSIDNFLCYFMLLYLLLLCFFGKCILDHLRVSVFIFFFYDFCLLFHWARLYVRLREVVLMIVITIKNPLLNTHNCLYQKPTP